LQNENGHLAIFEAAIPAGAVSVSLFLTIYMARTLTSNVNQTKPGKCQYDYDFKDPIMNATEQAQAYMATVSV
jgi:hypothetical protein